MTKEQIFLLKLISIVLNNQKLTWCDDYIDLNWEQVIDYAQKYNVENFLVYATEDDDKFEAIKSNNALHMAVNVNVAYDIQQVYSWGEIRDKLEECSVDCVPLKGIITKQNYPSTDLRSMGDIDLLYKDTQYMQMFRVMSDLGYDGYSEGIKHDHFTNKNGIHIEMHRDMVEAGTEHRAYYESIWDRVKLSKEYNHIYELSPEDNYIYTVVHLKEHFIHGGIGPRLVMDIYVLKQAHTLRQQYLDQEFTKLGLLDFEENIRKLAFRWFDTGTDLSFVAKNSALNELAEYILSNATFGNTEDAKGSAAYEVGGSKMRYLRYYLLPNLYRMQSTFLWLKKAPILLPVAWIIRIIKAVLFRRYNFNDKIQGMQAIDTEALQHGMELHEFYLRCGLKV